MPLDQSHVKYLVEHRLGRLATVDANGAPQNKPVGYSYDPDTGTITIIGYAMARSAKYRNIARHPNVAFVIDDAVGEGAAGMRLLEVRGTAEQAEDPTRAGDGIDSKVIVIHPRRVVSWNVDAHRPGLQTIDL